MGDVINCGCGNAIQDHDGALCGDCVGGLRLRIRGYQETLATERAVREAAENRHAATERDACMWADRAEKAEARALNAENCAALLDAQLSALRSRCEAKADYWHADYSTFTRNDAADELRELLSAGDGTRRDGMGGRDGGR